MLTKIFLFKPLFLFFSNHWGDKRCLEDQARERSVGKQTTVPTATFATDMHVIWVGWVRHSFLILFRPTLAALWSEHDSTHPWNTCRWSITKKKRALRVRVAGGDEETVNQRMNVRHGDFITHPADDWIRLPIVLFVFLHCAKSYKKKNQTVLPFGAL